jgi:hypothetical protein
MKRNLKYNYFYRIENVLNKRFYYGVHGTNNLNDSYFGSGTRLKYAIKKHGKENFIKEDLIFFDTYDEALEYEAIIVNEVLVNDPNCYNLRVGGNGGGFNNGKGTEWYKENGSIHFSKLWKDPEFRKRKIEEASKRFTALNKEGRFNYNTFSGKNHTQETKDQMSKTHQLNKHQQKENNSQFGTRWITNEKENKKIHHKDLIPDGWKLGRKY